MFIHIFQTFLHILDSNEEQFKEDLIKMRIEDAIVNFSKEASTLLPHPDLLQVIYPFSATCVSYLKNLKVLTHST